MLGLRADEARQPDRDALMNQPQPAPATRASRRLHPCPDERAAPGRKALRLHGHASWPSGPDCAAKLTLEIVRLSRSPSPSLGPKSRSLHLPHLTDSVDTERPARIRVGVTSCSPCNKSPAIERIGHLARSCGARRPRAWHYPFANFVIARTKVSTSSTVV